MLKDVLATWRSCHIVDKRPPPMIIETFLDTRQLSSNQSLVIIDEDGKRSDVSEALSALPRPSRASGSSCSDSRIVVLERWQIELGDAPDDRPADPGDQSMSIYQQVKSLFRSTWAYALFMPLWKFMKRRPKGRSSHVLTPCYRVFPGIGRNASVTDNLTTPLYQSNHNPVDTYSFDPIESPAGPLKISVTFRSNCEFRVDDSEALLSSRFMGADDRLFKPSLASDDTVRAGGQEVGSLPIDRGYDTLSEFGQAYGSMSTFHQVGPPTGTSPISALRAARDRGASPSSPSHVPSSPKHGQSAGQRERSGGSDAAQRRPSLSFQPFKAPPLSASPVPSHSRNISEPPKPTTATDDKTMPPPSTSASASRKQEQVAQESALAASTSASPKQAPISKYSSSFTHRRGRLSSGGTSKADDDNNSSGRVSTSSSTAQPSSDTLAEAGGSGGGGGGTTSSGSWHADDEHLSDFLKMLDMKKDFPSRGNSSAADANTRRTAAALTRFHKMKDTNAALSDSMSSSTLLQKSSSSSSRQLPNVPPMIPPTSMSTSSSPGKAMSPHTPHTPAIPSRLSSNSIVEYPHDTAGNRRRASRQSRQSPVEEASSGEATVEPQVSNSSAIDIPTSPPFIPDFRRASSAAQRRRDPAPEDELGNFYFGTRSMSLGVEDRSPLSLSALLQQQEQDDSPHSSGRRQQQGQQQPTTAPKSSEVTPESQSRPESSSANQPYQPRFPHPQGRGSIGRSPSRGSVSSSIGRGGTVASANTRDRDRDRETGNEGDGTSSIPFTATPDVIRRGSRFGAPALTMTLDEEEPLLFAMSDFGSSRRSPEEGRIVSPPGPRGRDAPAPPSSPQEDDSGRGGSAGGFRTWQ